MGVLRRLVILVAPVAAVAASSAVATAAEPVVDQQVVVEPTYAARRGCAVTYPSRLSYRKIKKMLRHHYPLRPIQIRRSKHYAVCVATRAKSRAVFDYIRRSYQWRRLYQHRWPIRLNALPASWIQWARNITFCESRWNRYASNGSHFSYFQWAWSTWASASAGFDAPASPYNASWPHQAVIAIHWAWRAGTSQWVCRG